MEIGAASFPLLADATVFRNPPRHGLPILQYFHIKVVENHTGESEEATIYVVVEEEPLGLGAQAYEVA
jgi:hypothetical protein